jgi:hypothetical protein
MTAIITAVLIPALVSLVVALITLFVFQPIQGQKQLIGEIDDATRYYRTATSKVRADWKNQGEREAAKAKAEEATQAYLCYLRGWVRPRLPSPRVGSPTDYTNPLTWSHRGRTLVKPLVSLRRGRIG